MYNFNNNYLLLVMNSEPNIKLRYNHTNLPETLIRVKPCQLDKIFNQVETFPEGPGGMIRRPSDPLVIVCELTLFLITPGPAIPTAIGPLGQKKKHEPQGVLRLGEVALQRLSSNRRRPVS